MSFNYVNLTVKNKPLNLSLIPIQVPMYQVILNEVVIFEDAVFEKAKNRYEKLQDSMYNTMFYIDWELL